MSGTYWNPKPMRPQSDNPLFVMVESELVVKGLSPMQRQRLADGTPMTVSGPTALRPADPTLVLKGSLVEKLEEGGKGKHDEVVQDPVDPLGVIKSFLEQGSKEAKKEDEVSKSQLVRMTASISNFAKSLK